MVNLEFLFQAFWNQLMLQSEDFAEATMGQISKEKNIKFSKL